jgi:pimeloyl-ACP methyl ester carboxylesterase
MATYVLVHGGWHGGWCWRKVTPLLRDAGHDVYAPTLTGLGERAHLAGPEVGLAVHIEDVANLLEYEDLVDVVLVGHSYGGMVITGAAGRVPKRVAQLVYLDAFVPADGQALVDLLPPERRDVFLEQARATGEGWRVPPPSPEFYGVTEEADLAWVRPRLVPQSLATFTEPLGRARATASPPRTYIACTASTVATFRPFAEHARADTAWRYHELATGHDAMVTMPEGLARLLLDAAEPRTL